MQLLTTLIAWPTNWWAGSMSWPSAPYVALAPTSAVSVRMAACPLERTIDARRRAGRKQIARRGDVEREEMN